MSKYIIQNSLNIYYVLIYSVMNNYDLIELIELKELILSTSMNTCCLISLWGLTNYINLKSPNFENKILFNKIIFGFDISITGTLFYNIANISHIILITRYSLNLIKLHRL